MAENINQDQRFMDDLVDAIDDIFYVFDARGRFLRWNKSFEKVSGYSYLEISRMKPSDFFTKDSALNINKAVQEAFRTGHANVEEGFLAKDGRLIPMFFSGRVIKDLSGQPILCGTGKDITDLKQKEEELRASEARYRAYIEVTGQISWITPVDGVVDDMPEWRKYTGQDKKQVKGWGWLDAIHPDDRARTTEVWKKAVAAKSNYETEYRIRRHDGVYRYFLARGIPSLREDGTIREWVGVCIDITERKQAEDKIRQTAEQWSKTFDAIADFLFIQDREFNLVKVNKAFADALKLKPEELIGKKCYALLHKLSGPWPTCPAAQTLKDKNPHTEEVNDPNIGISLLVSTSPILNERGEVTAIVHYAKDISERKKIEKELREAQADLEKRVEERTKELREKLNGLERFRQATVEREFRMKELRDEIERLKAGQQKKGI